jgi:hypothetical protein
MTLAEFKAHYGLKTIKFYDSSVSSRKVSSLPNGELIVTKEDFDDSKDIYVYTVAPSDENNLDKTIHVVSNTVPKAPTLEL